MCSWLNSNLFGAHWSPMEPTGANWSQLAWATVTLCLVQTTHTTQLLNWLPPQPSVHSLTIHTRRRTLLVSRLNTEAVDLQFWTLIN